MAKILVIDDELFYREIIKELLEKEGHKVFSASNAREGLDLVRQVEPDLSLVDIVLPGNMDGLAVLFKLKQIYPEMPVIMLSAYDDKKLILSALRRGAFDYLPKPIAGPELKHTVDQALERFQLIQERDAKLSRLANLEQGAGQLTQFVKGKIRIEEVANAYQLLETTLDLVSQVLECERVSVMLFEPAENKLKVVASKGMSKSLIKKESREPKATVSGWVFEHKEAVLVKDLNTDTRFQASEYSSSYKTNSFVIAPLMVGGVVVGTINANDKTKGENFDEDDLVLLKTFSHQIALTLQYLQAIAELEREKKRLELMAGLEKILVEERDPQVMLKQILKKCQEMMEVICASIYLKDEHTSELIHRVGWDGARELKVKHRIALGKSTTGMVAEQDKTVIINNPSSEKTFSQAIEWMGEGTIKNYIASPIKISERVIGVIRLLNRREGEFKKQDEIFLEEVAKLVGIALRNLELYQRLKRSVEELVQTNQMLSRANQELEIKTRELELLRKKR